VDASCKVAGGKEKSHAEKTLENDQTGGMGRT